jgi:hypothetical protein
MMNSDEIMAEPAGPMNSSSESQQQSKAAAAWNTKKFRDEYEAYKNRLLDQKFSVGALCSVIVFMRSHHTMESRCTNESEAADYPDPLAPRPPHPKQYPKGTDPELESNLQQLIARVKAGGGARSAALDDTASVE